MTEDEELQSQLDPTPVVRPRRRGSLEDPRNARRFVYVMLVYGVALIVGSLAYGYWTLPSAPSPSPVPCSLGTLPPTDTTPSLALAATMTSYPEPQNGSSTPEAFELWLNSTDRMLPDTPATFAVVPLSGAPSGPGCQLPIPQARWTASPQNLTLQPEGFASVAFEGTPDAAYSWSGIFAVQVWVNSTTGSGTTGLGSLHTELTVGS